jgi:hypothetical protein
MPVVNWTWGFMKKLTISFAVDGALCCSGAKAVVG